jgi:hypothetical protein
MNKGVGISDFINLINSQPFDKKLVTANILI